MPTIGWNESSPAGADSVGAGAGEFRSLKTAIRTALDGEHNFPSAGGDAGVHRLGSGRPFVGLQSAVSSSGTDGRMMVASDTSRFFHVGSGGTSFIGGPMVLSAGSHPGTQRHYWAMEFGTGVVTTGSSTTAVIFPNSGYSGAPVVVLTPYNENSLSYNTMLYIHTITATGFTPTIGGSGSAATNLPFTWMSMGSRVL